MKLISFFNNHKSILLYLVFGFLTTLISIFTFWLFSSAFQINELLSNILSWLIAVAFAFFTNRKWVFESRGQGFLLSALKFYLARVLTLLIEEGIIFIFITILYFNGLAVKTVAQVIIIVLNYIFSKIFVFKK
ncbi:MAG: GtrA family protein [Ruminococcaceae bacterium]|nr:GtrA family protein [Oscillospiraceae bacterium]